MNIYDDLTILITGETGTGKTVRAREIHFKSLRKNRPFIHVNIAAISENLFESELFGYKKGAFTGATTDKEGLLDSVNGGTLFLDEIGELNLQQQAKLLTVLEQKEYFPVGGIKTKKFNGSIIYATNKNLDKLVREGKFREDLYFRIRVNQIELRPLRESENIFEAVIGELNSLKAKYNIKSLFKAEVISLLAAYNWPGNYRELNSTIKVLLSLNKEKIEVEDLPSWIVGSIVEERAKCDDTYRHRLEEFEKALFLKIMQKNKGGVNKSAIDLNISKGTLISKLRKYGIDRRYFKNFKHTAA